MRAAYRVYILENREGKFDIGVSDDVTRRLEQHNTGQSRWIKRRGPWVIVWQSDELSLSEARKLENRLKRQKAATDSFTLPEFGSRQAPNPALQAGSLAQIQPRDRFRLAE
jgi:putative endonuclease